jgi:hypothetical protein
MPQPWERQEKETNKAWNAFRIYRDMDPADRSLVKVAQKLGFKYPTQTETWSREKDWVSRAGQYDAHIDELRRNQRERERLAASERRIQIAKNMQLVGGSKIQEIGKAIQEAIQKGEPLPAISLKDAALLIDAGVKIERLESGESTGKQELVGEGGGAIRVTHAYELVEGVIPPDKRVTIGTGKESP